MKFYPILFALFFSTTTLFAAGELFLAPIVSLPLGKMRDFFQDSLGVEMHVRGKTSIKYLSLIEDKGLNFAAGLSVVPYTMHVKDASKLTMFEAWVALEYPYLLPYDFTIIPRIGGGMYYANFLKSQRDESMSVLNPVLHVALALGYSLSKNFSIELSHGANFAYMGSPTWFNQAYFSLGVNFKIGVNPLKNSPASQLRDDIMLHYENGLYTEASREIEALEKIAPDDLVVEKYRSLIYQQRKYEAAKKQYTAGKIFSAMALLRQAPDIPLAQEDLAVLRSENALQVPNIITSGVKAYDKGDFDQCISSMEQVLLIDPTNADAQIYLPRAVNRRRALRRLK
ncbi:MAG: hypothetical protein LDLANPLL_02933 [Turneriella sp.]|nr:hypothetical protein [Turneriella sp.]